MRINNYVKLLFVLITSFGILTFSIFFGANVTAQLKNNNQFSDKSVPNSKAVIDDKTAFLQFSIEGKKNYYLGEKPIIKLVITNISNSEQKVLNIEHRKYRLRGEGIFNNGDGVRQVKDFNFDGRYLVFKDEPCLPKQSCEWIDPLYVEPTYLTLKPGEATSVESNLSNGFSAELFYPGNYKITAKTEDGEREAVAEFEVYFDAEKSTEYLVKRLQSESDADRNGAYFYLSKYNQTALVTTLEKMLQSDDPSIRRNAAIFLSEFKKRLEMKQEQP